MEGERGSSSFALEEERKVGAFLYSRQSLEAPANTAMCVNICSWRHLRVGYRFHMHVCGGGLVGCGVIELSSAWWQHTAR